jgi:hypothetical protein
MKINHPFGTMEKQSQTNPILPATPFGGQTRFDERSEASPILPGISLFSLFTFYSLFFLSPAPNSFSNNYLHKNGPSDSAQFKQFGALFSAISRVIQEQFELIQTPFETVGAMAPAIPDGISRQNTKNFPPSRQKLIKETLIATFGNGIYDIRL